MNPESTLQAEKNRPWRALAVLLTGNFVTILDLFIVNVALPSIQSGLSASDTDLQLIVVAYALAYGLCLINGARLGDLFGRRRLFLAGMGLFTVASALCGVAVTPWQLILARALQGVGAGVLMPQVLASIRVVFEGEARRRAFGIMGAVQGVAASISQLLGGMLITLNPLDLGWRLVFLINVPIGIAALLAGRRALPEWRAPVPTRVDLRGALAGAAGLALILVPVMEGREHGWPWWSLAGPVLALGVLAYFVRYEKTLARRGGVPVLDMALFANRPFVAGIGAVFFFFSAISSFFFALTLLLQFGLGFAPLAAGAVFTPSALAFFGASLAGPKLAARHGRGALLFGVLVFTVGLALSAVTAAMQPQNLALLVASLVLNGAGQGLVIPLAFNAILGSVQEEQAGMASGMLSTLQVVGTSTGVAVVGGVIFTMLEAAGSLSAGDGASVHGRALAAAMLYNIAAALLSLVLFRLATRR
ncbi:MFS transporter [Achromobacter xylosoxidans]|uniref:MFS transporter n=1 Tax=Alcaligenes xylosoxydans xylosoxydans TaxID=85698 RepID=A0A424WBN0_ALCXX|nr:MFS transporter [Achromobacter xylosoxidans]MBC9906701.1 MFS transporter [Achromobacter xylosoxidans]MBD0870255.1 MFS transporter [Achromobacter xylosoxidans]QNP83677.1 MFS transporter [Achromobacter xylosoxidans]RPJ90692.1 MFS transporter [Achromobacter xylosoxidans]